jgi:hypothetical protein
MFKLRMYNIINNDVVYCLLARYECIIRFFVRCCRRRIVSDNFGYFTWNLIDYWNVSDSLLSERYYFDRLDEAHKARAYAFSNSEGSLDKARLLFRRSIFAYGGVDV